MRILCLAQPKTSKQMTPTIAENHNLQHSIQHLLAAGPQAKTARLKAGTKLVIEGLRATGFGSKDKELASSLSGCHLVDCCSR